jgi:argininosuccinate lyase
MQEDKEAVFDALDTTVQCLKVTQTVFNNIAVNRDRAAGASTVGYMNATELADYLVRKGLPFRDAHETVGKIVLAAIERTVELDQLSLSDFRTYSDLIDEDVYEALSIEATLKAKRVVGGTSPEMVSEALSEARKQLH